MDAESKHIEDLKAENVRLNAELKDDQVLIGALVKTLSNFKFMMHPPDLDVVKAAEDRLSKPK